MPKQRGEQQSTGRRGEEAFRLFASRHGAPASRMEEDIAFDFVCIVEQPGPGVMKTLSGTWLGVSVRSTVQRSGRVRLNRSDAAAMLRANFPVCFVLAEVQRDTERLSYVNGQQNLLVGGHQISRLTDTSSPGGRTPDLQ